MVENLKAKAKRVVSIFVCLILTTGFLAGCKAAASYDLSKVQTSLLEGNSLFAIDILEGNSLFAIDIFKKLNEEDANINIFISTISISMVLTVT